MSTQFYIGKLSGVHLFYLFYLFFRLKKFAQSTKMTQKPLKFKKFCLKCDKYFRPVSSKQKICLKCQTNPHKNRILEKADKLNIPLSEL